MSEDVAENGCAIFGTLEDIGSEPEVEGGTNETAPEPLECDLLEALTVTVFGRFPRPTNGGSGTAGALLSLGFVEETTGRILCDIPPERAMFKSKFDRTDAIPWALRPFSPLLRLL